MSADVHYVGFDLHKKTIAYCVKTKDGKVRDEGMIRATRQGLSGWLTRRRQPRVSRGAMEATLFTGWVYDYLSPHARQIKVAHPAMPKNEEKNVLRRKERDRLCLSDSPRILAFV
jgi:transposase